MGQVMANQLERFHGDIDRLREKVQEMQRINQSMFEEIHALTGMWTGAAHDAYLQQFQNDHQNMKQLIQLLGDYCTSLEQAEHRYQKCVQDVDSVVTAIRI